MEKLILVLDTETTGLGHMDHNAPREDGVIQVGFAYRGQSGQICTWQENCNPGEKYFENGRAKEALDVNKHTIEMIRTYKPAKVVASELQDQLDGLAKLYNVPVYLTSYNTDFDRPFLVDRPWKTEYPWAECLMKYTVRNLFAASRFNHYALKKAATALGVINPAPHTALGDAETALLVYEKLKARTGEELKI